MSVFDNIPLEVSTINKLSVNICSVIKNVDDFQQKKSTIDTNVVGIGTRIISLIKDIETTHSVADQCN